MNTGDMGNRRTGFFYLLHRKKEVIITVGGNVYSTEMEAVRLQHPAVSESAANGVPDPVWRETVEAFVVLERGDHVPAEELRAFCRERGAGYTVPRAIEFPRESPENSYWKNPARRKVR